MDNADIANWLKHTKIHLRVCQVPESMWLANGTRHLSGPAQTWFTTWATDKVEITWEGFSQAAKTRYSGAFAPIVIGIPMLAIKKTGTMAKYLPQWRAALNTAPTAINKGNTMVLTLIDNVLKAHVCKWVPFGSCTSIKECFKAAVKASNQASMVLRKNDLPAHSLNSSAHRSQVGRFQPRQHKNGAKQP